MEILSNTKNSRPVKVLNDRLNRTIKQFFLSQYSTAERAAVQRVIMDMNASYQAFVHELFPNAELIIDRFHIIQLMGRTMDTIRTQLTNIPRLLKPSSNDI
jgi:transposase